MTVRPSRLPAGVVEHHGVTGQTVWTHLPDCTPEFGIMWSGRASRLFIGRPMTPGGAVMTIEHPTADGIYYSRAEARAAVAAFLASPGIEPSPAVREATA